MRVKRIKLTNFKRFSNLTIDSIPETTKLVVMVGPNGSGKTSIMEAMNHFYKCSGFGSAGDYQYLRKIEIGQTLDPRNWIHEAVNLVDIEFYDHSFPKQYSSGQTKGHFYFRSAYRNEPDFTVDTMNRQPDPTKELRLNTLIENDQTISKNYQALVATSVNELFKDENQKKYVEDVTNKLTGKIKASMEKVFKNLMFTSLGNPLSNGTFYFSKGASQNFQYKNLSAGEKAAFDLILDMVVQSQYFPDAIYCIDEPETHMHTQLQGKVLRELYSLVPDQSQLWISTHSIGMLQEAEEIESNNPGTVTFLDFGNRNFDQEQLIQPVKIGKKVLEKFYELAFGDFAKLMLPEVIVFCEGTHEGKKRKDFDQSIYNKIFENRCPTTLFISAGNCNDIIELQSKQGGVINTLLNNCKVIRLIDRDDCSSGEIESYNKEGIKVLQRRNLESYLLDDTVITKLCELNNQNDKIQSCLEAKQRALRSTSGASDDLKSVRGVIYNELKKILGLTQGGKNADSFIRYTLTPLITPDMQIYKELESDIFGYE